MSCSLYAVHGSRGSSYSAITCLMIYLSFYRWALYHNRNKTDSDEDYACHKMCLCVCLHLPACLFACLQCVCLSLCRSLCAIVCLPALCMDAYRCAHASICFPLSLCIYLSLPVHLSVSFIIFFLFVCPYS